MKVLWDDYGQQQRAVLFESQAQNQRQVSVLVLPCLHHLNKLFRHHDVVTFEPQPAQLFITGVQHR